MKKLYTYNINTESLLDYENGFYITSHPRRIGKIIGQYEIYKSIIDLPGDFIECGIYRGQSFFRFCAYREMLESDY